MRIATSLLFTAASAVLSLALPAQDAGSTYGHARTRALAELGRLPSPTDVGVADLVNFHRHRLPLPRAGEPVALDLRFGSASFDHRGEAVLQIGFTAAETADRRDLGPVHLGLAIDCSGSMAAENKLEAVQRALRVLVQRLRPQDRITLVAWSDEARVLATCASAADPELGQAIDGLRPDGSTNLHAGLITALREVTARSLGADGLRRVILLTDGIANRGEVEPGRILADALAFTSEGVDLATIGFGTELNGDLLDRLARGARGMFHFVRDGKDIEKVFVDELQAQLRTVAREVVLHLSLPPEVELGKVFGHRARMLATPGEYEIDLPDLNAGATQVVIATCWLRRAERSAWASEGLAVRATLDCREAGADGLRREFPAETLIESHRGEGATMTDAEVAKNYTIARVAQGLHDMAVAAQQRHWAAADRALQDALRCAELRFPSGDDVDLARVTDMARRFRGTLRPYLDRFRDS